VSSDVRYVPKADMPNLLSALAQRWRSSERGMT